MKMQKVLPVLLVLSAAFQNFRGQERPQAYLIDEFGKICSEDLMSRYDNYLTQLNDNPAATGYFVFYGDDDFEGRNLNFIAFLQNIYPVRRKIDKSRIIVRRGEIRSKMHTQFWLVPAGADPPAPDKEFVPGKVGSTTLFDKNWADFYRDEYSRKMEIYSNNFLDLGCEFSPNAHDFARTLLADPNLTGYLIVYTKFGKGLKHGNQVAAFAVNDLMKNYKVPRNRLKTIYGGNRQEPEIELWFVPKGDKPPTPDSKQGK